MANLLVDEEAISPDQEEALEMILQKFKGKPGSLIQALHAVQNLIGYLPPPVLKKVSHTLDIPLSEIYGVVTFYHFFSLKPRGKHIIQVCLGTACYVRGGQEILNRLEEELGIGVGEITEDKLYSLEVMRCAGACGLAPVVKIDNDIYKRVNPTQIMEIVKSYS
ncbi:MAG TPA: NAD(P)H-dependent oxidoreductase subunit E [Candidatus Atribacteria bacterium]|nr:NAD(P)H-dependent oxidoreductase subunit E [Candidatus Atribacteria bacterium]HQE25483.1 NAD(P)H-dependent oxidoreductase subunit E [Candidatus Atribacteria bacterium]